MRRRESTMTLSKHGLLVTQAVGASLVGAAAMLAPVGTAGAQARPIPFKAPYIAYETSVFPEGTHPWSSRVADFNEDGTPDLATISFGGQAHLSILLGDGEGGYLAPTIYPALLEGLDLEVGDFDRDGHIDIATCDTDRFFGGASISIWRGDGSGAFEHTSLVNAGRTGPSSITTADFNGDGWLDLAVAHDKYIEFGETIAVILANGAGGFEAPQVYTLAAGTRSIASGDIDGDGQPDLVVGHETNRWTHLRNTGDGSFTVVNVHNGIEAGSIPELPAVHVADIDRDNDADVFFANRDTGGPFNGAIGLWRNNGGGSGFAAPETIDLQWSSNGGVNITTADVTGDGWLDLLTTTGNTHHWFLVPGDGQGGLLAPQRFRAGENTNSIEAADLNGDGAIEMIVLASGSFAACVYTNLGGGEFYRPDIIDLCSSGAPTNLAAGDIDGDGDLDLVAGSIFQQIGVARNDGRGSFAAPQIYSTSPEPLCVRLRDIDGDRSPDLVWIDGDGAVRSRLNNGAGAFGSVRTASIVDRAEKFDLWDVDADGDLDVVAAAYWSVEILMNNGAGAFGSPTSTPIQNPVWHLGMADLNRDGFPDLITDTGSQASAQVRFANGDGTFGQGYEVSSGRGVAAIGGADLNRDGVMDFATAYNLDEKGLGVRLGRGDGNFHLLDMYHGAHGWYDHTSGVRLADLEGDGEVDAITANFSAEDVSFWRGIGGGDFDRVLRLGVGEQAHDVQFGDFTGDGVTDIAVLAQVDAFGYLSWYPGAVILEGTNARSGYGLVLSQTALVRGETTTFSVSGAQPDENIYLIYSTRGVGSGPCPPQLGGLCLDLRMPVTQVGTAQADANGVAQFAITIPQGAPIGARIHTQAVARRGAAGATSFKSYPVSAEVQP